MKMDDEVQTAFVLGDALPALVEGPDEQPNWELDWADGEEVVIQDQRAIAVYTNTRSGVVIRQERAWDEDEDTVIVLSTPGCAKRVIEAIQRELNAIEERRK